MYINNDIDYLKFLKDKKIVIFGVGVKGKKAFHSLSGEGYEVVAFCDNDEKKQGGYLFGKKILSVDELCSNITNSQMVIICSRYERQIREQLINKGIFNFISVSQIDFGGGEEYYNEQYFSWQRGMGEFGGRIQSVMFQPYIKEDMAVVEFGSGGGYLLHNITAREKIGVEINDAARKTAAELGIKSVKHVSELPDGYADIVISTHVLEHVENPLGVLRELRDKLKEGGKIVFYVPNESCDVEYIRSEVNNHLYTWNCLTLGNLFKAAGYFVYSVRKVQEKWPDNYIRVEQEVSPELFEALCNINGRANDENNCLIVAYK